MEIGLKIPVRRTGCCGTDWIYVAEEWGQRGALVNTVMNLRVQLSAGNFFDG
jgi:hypothetical protein